MCLRSPQEHVWLLTFLIISLVVCVKCNIIYDGAAVAFCEVCSGLEVLERAFCSSIVILLLWSVHSIEKLEIWTDLLNWKFSSFSVLVISNWEFFKNCCSFYHAAFWSMYKKKYLYLPVFSFNIRCLDISRCFTNKFKRLINKFSY